MARDGTLYSGSDDETIKVWNTTEGTCVKTMIGHTSWVCALAVAPDGTLYSGSTDGTIKAWSTNDGVCVKTLEGHTDWVSSLALTPDGTLYSGSHDWSIKVWKDKEKRPKRANEGTDSETSPKAQKIEINTSSTMNGSRNGVLKFTVTFKR